MSLSAQSSLPVSEGSPVSSNTIIPPEIPQEPPKKNALHIPKLAIILIVVYAILLYGFVGYLIVTKKQPEPITTINTVVAPPQIPQLETEIISSGSATGFTAKELAKLRVINLSTHWQDWYTSNTQTDNQYISVVLPKELVDKVSAYQSTEFMYIAPKQWYGDVDISTRYGNSSRLFPNKDFDENGPIIRVFFSGQSPREGLIIASSFFPWIREHAKELMIENEVFPPTDATISAVTPHFMLYSDIIDNLYEVHGAIYSNADAHLEDKQAEMIQMEVRLPKEDRDFAKQLIDVFVQQYNLKNR